MLFGVQYLKCNGNAERIFDMFDMVFDLLQYIFGKLCPLISSDADSVLNGIYCAVHFLLLYLLLFCICI